MSRRPSSGPRGWAGGCWRWVASGWPSRVNYGQVYPDLHPRLVLTATLLSVLLFEIVASREARLHPRPGAGGRRARRPTTGRSSRCRGRDDPATRRTDAAGRRRGPARAASGADGGRHRSPLALPVRHPPAHRRHLRRPGPRPRASPGWSGYLVAGLALGPSALGIVPARRARRTSAMMKQLAVGLIALLAGAELRVSRPGERYRTILWILALQIVAVLVVTHRAGTAAPAPGFPSCSDLDAPGAAVRRPAVRGDPHGQLARWSPWRC